MRIQIIELPSQTVGEVTEYPYLLVLSELPQVLEGAVQAFRKDDFDHCAGIIATTEPVRVGEESAYEMQRREERQLREAEGKLGLPYGSLLTAATPDGRPDVVAIDPHETVAAYIARFTGANECPENEEGRGCACVLDAQDCPVNGRTPGSIGVMDIAHEERAVTVTKNEGGTRVAHIAIDVDQTPEELASDVAAIVEEQRDVDRCAGRESCEIMCCKDESDIRLSGQFV